MKPCNLNGPLWREAMKKLKTGDRVEVIMPKDAWASSQIRELDGSRGVVQGVTWNGNRYIARTELEKLGERRIPDNCLKLVQPP